MKKIRRTVRRRRKEGKTDYKARIGMLKSQAKRIVVRKTNRYIIGQVVSSETAQDRVILSINSKQLLKVGWPKEMSGSLKSLSASYLTGYMLGKKIKDNKNVILDIGLQKNVKKSRIYAFLRGLVESGLDIKYSDDVLPGYEMIKKGKAEKIFDKIKGEIK